MNFDSLNVILLLKLVFRSPQSGRFPVTLTFFFLMPMVSIKCVTDYSFIINHFLRINIYFCLLGATVFKVFVLGFVIQIPPLRQSTLFWKPGLSVPIRLIGSRGSFQSSSAESSVHLKVQMLRCSTLRKGVS